MGVMDKFLNAMKFNNDDEDDFFDDDYLDDEEEIEQAPAKTSAPARSTRNDEYEERAPRKNTFNGNKITSIKAPAKKLSANGMEVCVIKPSSYEEAREITETLLANRTVVLNLEGLDVDIAQRVIDFTSGSCFAIKGNLQQISRYIFIITPASVDISGDFQDIFGGSLDISINN